MKKSVLRIFVSLLTLCIVVGMVAACGNKAPTKQSNSTTDTANNATPAAQESTPEPKKGVTISVAADPSWIGDTEKGLAEAYAKQSGNKIDWQFITADQLPSVLKTKFAAGEGPDVVYIWSGSSALQFLPSKNFADLSNEPWVSRYQEAVKANVTYEGKVMAFSTNSVSNGWGLWYNKALFNKYNLEAPKTYEDLLNVSATLKSKGIVPIYTPTKDLWPISLWFSQMAPVVQKNDPNFLEKLNSNQINYADAPELETFLTQMKELYDKGYMGKSALSDTWDKADPTLDAGKAAMFVTCDAYWNMDKDNFKQYDSVNDFAMVPIPMAGNKYIAKIAGGVAQFVNKNSKNVDAAIDYINFLAEPENLKTYYDGNPRYQANPDFVDIAGKADPIDDAWVAASEGFGGNFEFGAAYYDHSTVGKYLQDLLVGKKNAKQVLQALDADRIKLLNAGTK